MVWGFHATNLESLENDGLAALIITRGRFVLLIDTRRFPSRLNTFQFFGISFKISLSASHFSKVNVFFGDKWFKKLEIPTPVPSAVVGLFCRQFRSAAARRRPTESVRCSSHRQSVRS